MAELSAEVSQDAMSAAIRFADGGGRVLAVLGAGVDALNKLAGMSDAVPGSFLKFATYVRVLIGRMAELAAEVSQEAMSAAIKFAEGGGKVLGVLKTGVDALNALANLADAVPGSFLKFATYVRVLIGRMAEMAAEVSQEALSAAVRFAESAGKVLAIIKAGVEALSALANVTNVPAAAFQTFANGIDAAITAIWNVSLDFTAEGMSAAAAFADSAGKVLAVIKAGVEGLASLAEVESVPASAFQIFANGIDAAITAIWNVALDFTEEGVKAAAVFAEGAGKALGILKTGVEGLASLASLKPIAAGAIQTFVAMVNILMTDLGTAAGAFSADALAAAGKFADAATKSVGILQKGVEGFYAVDTFSGVSAAAIQRFADGVKLAVEAMVRLAGMFSAEALAAAKSFADVAEASTEFLKKGASGFDRLGEMKVKPGAGLDAFAAGIQQLIATMIRLAVSISTEALTQANRLAVGLDGILTVIIDSIRAFGDIADIVGGGDLGAVNNGLGAAATNLISGLKALIIPKAEDLGAQVLPAVLRGIASTFAAVQTQTVTLGMAMSLGIAAGITAGTPAIQNAIVAALQAALATARSALGIASPSKVFDELVGYQSGAGVAQGFERSIPMVTAAAGSMAAASIAPVAAATAGPVGPRGLVAGGGGGGGAQNLTIEKGAITIVQQPGESGDALAQRVMKLIEAKYRLRG
jgi:hypothetical protein